MGNDNQEAMQIGYVKAKFAIHKNGYLEDSAAYQWCCELVRPRVTENFVYITLGHSLLPSNDTARDYLRQIAYLKGKVTRLDFCVDYLGKFAFDSFYKLHDNKIPPTPSIVTSPSGQTVYIGKRSSARMLRVYDKRGEILQRTIKAKNVIATDIGFELTRFEIEIKRGMVQRYLTLFMSGMTDIILSDMQTRYGLHGFCGSHERAKPIDIPEKTDNIFNFIYRYKRVIREAYTTDKEQFLDIIGEKEQC
jgi:hypothetical protein